MAFGDDYVDSDILFPPLNSWIRELYNNRSQLRALMKPRTNAKPVPASPAKKASSKKKSEAAKTNEAAKTKLVGTAKRVSVADKDISKKKAGKDKK